MMEMKKIVLDKGHDQPIYNSKGVIPLKKRKVHNPFTGINDGEKKK